MSSHLPSAPQWADASPASLFSLGAGTTAVWAALTGRVGPDDSAVLVVWLLAVALVQVITGLVALRRGDSAGGSLNLLFGILFWAAPACTTALVAFPSGAPSPAQVTLVMNGWVFAFLGLVLLAHVPLMAAQSKLLLVAMLLFVVAVALLAAFNLRPPLEQAVAPWPRVAWSAGWLIGIAGLCMSYLGVALIANTAFGRVLVPVPGPLGFARGE
jgi:succinate-acetate transporter protein